MLAWIRSHFRRHDDHDDDEVRTIEQQQVQKFREWDNVLAEVDRVQRVAAGRPVPIERRHVTVPHAPERRR
jgi:hypothetical protein